MTYVITAPELLATAATDLATIGSNLDAAHRTAAAATVAVLPAAADEVSASIAQLLSQHAQDYQALAGQAAAFHDQFARNLTANAGSYGSTEAASAASLASLGAYLIGGYGDPGLLPLIAVRAGTFLGEVDPFPVILQLIHAAVGTPQTAIINAFISTLDELVFLPPDLALIPWLLLYARLTGKIG
jgi:PE family